jgi:hypothetical protein
VEFETDSGNIWEADAAGVDRQGGRRAVEGVKGQRGNLDAAEAEGRCE